MKSVRFCAPLAWRLLTSRAAVGAWFVAAAVVAPLSVQAREASAIIGQVTWFIGSAKLVAMDGSSSAVAQGMQVRVGDRVETEVNGHVSLRFVDGQLVTVRPLSRLLVENYEQTAIKFRLDEGVVRSITGKWGEAARDRFRLNTPVAAIGIKGTDFVVKTDGDKSYATVISGAVVMSQLTEACQASLGVCRTGDEKLLSADMKGQMLEISRLQTSPRLVPAVDLLSAGARGTVEASIKAERGLSADAGRPDMSSDKSALSESRGATIVVAGQASVTTPIPPTIKAPVVAQLDWVRSPITAAMDGDNFSKSFEQASAAGRQATVVTDGGYGLYRQLPAGQSPALQTAETSANFRLAAGAASLYVTNLVKYEPVAISEAKLNIDFAKSSFTTQLNLTSASMGTDVLSLTGGVNSAQSLFSGANGTTTVNGAMSVDGKEAAYLFSKQVSLGILNGYTLWGR
jgi:hypothetical protein